MDTVTLNRKTAMAVSDETHPGGSVQKPRSINDESPPPTSRCRTTGWPTGFRFTPRR
ncbi:putative membrane domain protein [Mycobacterium xenopi 3993]|nr:putative membrane domain protein [Mycobacterium xenopi 3993]